MKSYLRILQYAREKISYGILAVVFLTLYNVFAVFSLTLLVPFLDILFNEKNFPAPASPLNWLAPDTLKAHLMYQLGQWVESMERFDALLWICGILLGSIFLKNLFRFMGAWCIAPLEMGAVTQLRRTLFQHLSKLSLGYFTGKQKGHLINVVVSDVQVIQDAVITTILPLLRDPVNMLLILLTLLFISWKLTLFTLLILPVTALFLNFISKSLRRKARGGQERLGNLVSILDEVISGIRIVKAFVAEAFAEKKYDQENRAYADLMISLKRRSALASPFTEVVSMVVVVMIILFGANLIFTDSGEIRSSEFITFVAIFSQLLTPIKALSNSIAKIQKGLASFHRVEEFLAEERKVEEAPGAVPVAHFESSIRFDGVSFRYDTEEVLSGINFELKKGEMVALVGASGGGKSTLADLLPRFYDPVAGKILLDGKDLKAYRLADLRKLFGVVTQEGILFNDTLQNNIAYGEETPDLERVREAARIANAASFIEALPEGYQTLLGERGTRLSGGQRQRIAIARAIYQNPPILILDEATSALDSESEALVQEALDHLMSNRTSLVIAHRLSTITNAHRILVVDRGRIIESGRHDELLARQGVYQRLYSIQFD